MLVEHERIAENAWDELGVEVNCSIDEIIESFRRICIHFIMESKLSVDQFQRKAIAYRFLNSIPISKQQFKPTDILPLLRPLDKGPDALNHLRASSLLDISIGCLERAQKTWEMPYVNYVINVHYCLRKHVVRRRYSEFVALHNALAEKLPVLPLLPAKSWYSKFSVDSLLARDLALYLTRVVVLLSERGVFELDIMAFLEIDFDRIRAEEEGLAVQVLSKSRVPFSNGVYYAIHSKWLRQWTSYVSAGTSAPGPITNSHLSDHSSKTKKLQVVTDYRLLPSEVWRYFYRIYRGGPEIARRSNNIYDAKAFDIHAAALTIQRIVRGHRARLEALRRRDHLYRSNERDLDAEEHREALQRIRIAMEKKEQQVIDSAARKLQCSLRSFMRKTKSQRQPTRRKLLHDWIPCSKLTLSQITQLESSPKRIAHTLYLLKAGLLLTKLNTFRFGKPINALFTLEQDGSKLWWNNAKNHAESIAFEHVTAVKEGADCVLEIVVRRSKPLRLQLSSTAERSVVAEAIKELVDACKSWAESGAYIDSYGTLRSKSGHAKQYMRQNVTRPATVSRLDAE